MNIENFKLVLNQIKSHPETWDQKNWHCESAHCFFGWAQILSGKAVNTDNVLRDARSFLETTKLEEKYIVNAYRTIEGFEKFLNFYKANPSGYDEEGYNFFKLNKNGGSRDFPNDVSYYNALFDS